MQNVSIKIKKRIKLVLFVSIVIFLILIIHIAYIQFFKVLGFKQKRISSIAWKEQLIQKEERL